MRTFALRPYQPSMRRPLRLVHTARPLQGSGTRRSNAQGVAPHPQEGVDEQAAPEEGAELAFDEVGQPHSIGARGGGGEEGFIDHPMQDGVAGLRTPASSSQLRAG